LLCGGVSFVHFDSAINALAPISRFIRRVPYSQADGLLIQENSRKGARKFCDAI
jgi:hypothetical protein